MISITISDGNKNNRVKTTIANQCTGTKTHVYVSDENGQERFVFIACKYLLVSKKWFFINFLKVFKFAILPENHCVKNHKVDFFQNESNSVIYLVFFLDM